MDIQKLRDKLKPLDRVSIPRETFEAAFRKTNERIEFTFNGWDGKSYDGESRFARVYRCTLEGYEGSKFVKVGKCLHWIDEERLVLDKATGRQNPQTHWLIIVLRA